MTSSIYVGNLPITFTNDEFQQLFVEMGPISSVVLKEGRSKDGTQMFKYGFVNFEESSSVDVAISQCQGKLIMGRVLTVRKSEKSKNRSLLGNTGRPNPNWNDGAHQNNRGSEDVKKLQGYEEMVSITHVVDPHTLYVQALNRDNLEKFSVVMAKLQDYCNSAPRLHELHQDRIKIYGAIFQEDEAWYRCRVLNQNQNKAEVLYIDYGNSAEVDINTMVQLSDELASIGPIAQKIRIIGVAPVLKDSSSDAASQAYTFLGTLEAEGGDGKQLKIIIAEGIKPQEDGSLPVQLFHNHINVAQTINKRFAPGYQEKVIQASSSRPPPLKTGGGGGGAGNQWKNKELQGGGGDVNGINGHKTHHHNNKDMSDLMKRLENLEGVMEQLKDDKFILQKQLLHHKTEVEKKKEEESKKMSCVLQSHLTPLAESFQRIKEARTGFSVDPDNKNTILQAIDLAAKRLHPFMEGSPTKEKGDLISLIPDSEPVGIKLQELERMQQVLQNLQSQADLADAMLKRNDARHEAYKALTSFLDDVKKLPIAKRLKDIESMVNQLESEYGSYLDPTKVMQPDHSVADVECFDEYQAWLEERSGKITPLRDETNELRMKWCELLTNMNKSFLFDDICSPSLESTDKLRDDFLVAMETELTFTLHGYTPSIELDDSTALQTKQEQDVREVEVVSSTVHALVKALVKEKQTLASLAQVCDNFTTMAAQLNPWLNNRPDVSCLQTIMKEVKGHRSRLRHKVADKKDLEEDAELHDEKCMEELQDEIHSIQGKLWTLYQKEDALLRELSELTANHYPELPFLYPSIGISKFLETNGLVKDGRDLTHFDLSPVPDCKKTTVKLAKANGKPVSVIKVIHLPDKHTLDKMIAYSVIEVPACMKLHAVYPESDGSQLFLQLPYMGLGNLESAVKEEGLLSRTDIINVCRNVLMALEGLHRLGLVHGGVHPRNVLLEQRMEGKMDEEEEVPCIIANLAEFDFTMTTSETALKGFTSETGMRFTAPEVNCGLQATSQADIFACGLLLLWALFPTRVFKVEPDGTPDLEGCNLPPSLTEVLDSMLNYSPSKRPSAARVMESAFFTNPPEFAKETVTPMEVAAVDAGDVSLNESSLCDIPEGEENKLDVTAPGDLQMEHSQQTTPVDISLKTPSASPVKESMTGEIAQDSPGQVQDSPRQIVQGSPGHAVQGSPGHAVQGSPGHTAQDSPGHKVQVSPGHAVQDSPGHAVQDSPKQVVQDSPRQIVQDSPGLVVEQSPGCEQAHDETPVDQGEEQAAEKPEAVVQESSQFTLEPAHKVEEEAGEEASDCDSEPPPLEDDEVIHHVPTLVERSVPSEEPVGVNKAQEEADDNSSPV